jgi:hypothetical protein
MAPAADYEGLFDRTEGWTGGDGIYSAPLSDGSILWLFGDTFINRYTSPRMVNNTIAIQRGPEVEFFWGDGPTAFFKPPDAKGYFWPGAAVATDRGLVLFLHLVETTGKGAFGFKLTGTYIARVPNPLDPPREWRVSYERLPWFQEGRFYGVAALVEGGRVHVYGVDKGALTLARMDPWEFLEESGWSKEPKSPKVLLRGAATEGSVSKVGGKYVYVSSGPFLSPTIQIRTASAPEGPWSAPVEVYKCAEPTWDKSYFCYAAKAHPELAKGDELVITYACNGGDLGKVIRDRRIYRPRFVRVALP